MKTIMHAIFLSAALLLPVFCATQAPATNCSIGIGRVSFSNMWDLTVYNVPLSAQRQDWNIIATLKKQSMGKGESITIPTSAGLSQAITISNVDNAPVFDYDMPELRADWEEPSYGLTKTLLNFSIPDAKYSWTTQDCGATNVIYSGGFEGWTCDFPCSAAAVAKEQ
ncbi:hypothetical protein N0V93_008183 [Gnomoniopsis smithogilvyi]|uniref:Uncharacterized protein n=1 Tax=Gnomoniopsis smithogilvyi TaxID=1191159 RepID=A0A9W9CUH9_9PEZI|nr:hypothetical protein N0V93_008183 [Gnomoniopsis smithogilvyi]